MQGPNASTKSFKKAFLKNLLLSLCKARASSFGNTTSLHERKLTIKYSADVAMAAARAASCPDARWPKAILSSSGTSKEQRSRSIVRRCCRRKRSWGRSGRAGGGARGHVARRLVRMRTMALREVIPGGRDAAVDEATLFREAMDYAVHLRAQVDVLHRLSQAVQRSSSITLS